LARRLISIRRWLRQISSHSPPFLLEEQVLAVAAGYMAGRPLRLLDGVDWWMFEGGVRDAQLVEAAQQSCPVGRHGGSYSQVRAAAATGQLHQPALMQMSPGVICRRVLVSVIPAEVIDARWPR
jgi:hypothetical protein